MRLDEEMCCTSAVQSLHVQDRSPRSLDIEGILPAGTDVAVCALAGMLVVAG